MTVRTKGATARRLAKLKNKTIADAAFELVESDYPSIPGETPLVERLEALAKRYRAFPETGLAAGKEFFDDLSGEATER